MRSCRCLALAAVLIVATAVSLEAQVRLPNCQVRGDQLEEDMWENLWKQNWDGAAKLISPAFQSIRDNKFRDRDGEIAFLKTLSFKFHFPHDYRTTYSGDAVIVSYKIGHYADAPGGKGKKIRVDVDALSVWRHTPRGWQWVAHVETGGGPPAQSAKPDSSAPRASHASVERWGAGIADAEAK
jgi:hypothetical protein